MRRPDSAEGARSVLREDSLIPDSEIDSAQVDPDPQVEGVWKVDGGDWQAIVYLGGYSDPWGQERDRDDWETNWEV